MYQSKPVTILKTFLPKEFKKLLQVLRSESRDDQPELVLLFEVLKKAHPKYDQPYIEREELFKKVFPGQAYNEKLLRYLLSDFTKILEAYLVASRLEKNTRQKTSLLLQAYRDRDLEKFFVSLLEKENKKLEKERVRDINFYLHRFRMSEILSDFEYAKWDRSRADLLAQNMDKLDQFYIASKLRSSCLMQNFRDLHISDYQPKFLEGIVELIDQSELKEVLFIRIYRKILLTLLEPDVESHYHELVADLDNCHEEFSPAGLNEIYSFARNYCVKKINSSRPEYLKILFDLYKKMIEREVIFRGGYLPQWDYKNMVTLCCKLGFTDYGEKFLEEYRERIHPDFRKNAFNFNSAGLFFYKKDYDKTLSFLQKVNLSQSSYHIETKTLLMKTYYELQEMIPLFSLFDSFNIYLRRSKEISPERKNKYTYFIKYLKRISRIRLGGSVDPVKVKTQMNAEKGMIDITWLNAKADALIEKKR